MFGLNIGLKPKDMKILLVDHRAEYRDAFRKAIVNHPESAINQPWVKYKGKGSNSASESLPRSENLAWSCTHTRTMAWSGCTFGLAWSGLVWRHNATFSSLIYPQPISRFCPAASSCVSASSSGFSSPAEHTLAGEAAAGGKEREVAARRAAAELLRGERNLLLAALRRLESAPSTCRARRRRSVEPPPRATAAAAGPRKRPRT